MSEHKGFANDHMPPRMQPKPQPKPSQAPQPKK